MGNIHRFAGTLKYVLGVVTRMVFGSCRIDSYCRCPLSNERIGIRAGVVAFDVFQMVVFRDSFGPDNPPLVALDKRIPGITGVRVIVRLGP